MDSPVVDQLEKLSPEQKVVETGMLLLKTWLRLPTQAEVVKSSSTSIATVNKYWPAFQSKIAKDVNLANWLPNDVPDFIGEALTKLMDWSSESAAKQLADKERLLSLKEQRFEQTALDNANLTVQVNELRQQLEESKTQQTDLREQQEKLNTKLLEQQEQHHLLSQKHLEVKQLQALSLEKLAECKQKDGALTAKLEQQSTKMERLNEQVLLSLSEKQNQAVEIEGLKQKLKQKQAQHQIVQSQFEALGASSAKQIEEVSNLKVTCALSEQKLQACEEKLLQSEQNAVAAKSTHQKMNDQIVTFKQTEQLISEQLLESKQRALTLASLNNELERKNAQLEEKMSQNNE